jgi:hypothetical protein
MGVTEALRGALAAGSRHALADERAVAVLAAEPAPGMRVYVIAFERGDGELSYLALDGDHRPLAERRLVRDAVTLVALKERAEEVSGAATAAELAARFEELVGALREPAPAAAAAAHSVARAARALAGETGAPRVATPAYLDLLLRRSLALGEALDAYVEEARALAGASAEPPVEGPARAAWDGLALVAGVGDPSAFAPAMAAATGAVEALADDVLRRYREPLPP